MQTVADHFLGGLHSERKNLCIQALNEENYSHQNFQCLMSDYRQSLQLIVQRVRASLERKEPTNKLRWNIKYKVITRPHGSNLWQVLKPGLIERSSGISRDSSLLVQLKKNAILGSRRSIRLWRKKRFLKWRKSLKNDIIKNTLNL